MEIPPKLRGHPHPHLRSHFWPTLCLTLSGCFERPLSIILIFPKVSCSTTTQPFLSSLKPGVECEMKLVEMSSGPTTTEKLRR